MWPVISYEFGMPAVNPLKVSNWFLGGFHTPIAPQGSPKRSPHPEDFHVYRTCNAFLTLSYNSKLELQL
ncbi:hypothetical protein TNCV_253861 [Trichonephila clavipes]|nr:hypothetical protein TNCV_253861 [Trichonephila clavipes]